MSPDRKLLLLGKNGQLGWELQRTLAPLGSLTAIDYEDVDFVDSAALRGAVRQLGPQIIVNAAAYTDVDGAEKEPERAYAINATAPGVLAEEAGRLHAAFIHYSTDYVFDGTKASPYNELDQPKPLNVYGTSKLAGEKAVQSAGVSYLILRTAWVYSARGNNFVSKVLQWSRQRRALRIVQDQVSNPTWARLLAEVTAQLLAAHTQQIRERTGLYHLAGAGFASRLDWARAVLEFDPRREEQVMGEIIPGLTSEFPTPAQRPLFSALDCTRFSTDFGLELPHWKEALRLAMAPDPGWLRN